MSHSEFQRMLKVESLTEIHYVGGAIVACAHCGQHWVRYTRLRFPGRPSRWAAKDRRDAVEHVLALHPCEFLVNDALS